PRSVPSSSGSASRSRSTAWRSSFERSALGTRGVRAAAARARASLPHPPPVQRDAEQRAREPRADPGLGREPLLLPDQYPAQGCGDPVELPGPQRAPPMGAARPRSRRSRRRRRRDRVVAASRGRGWPFARARRKPRGPVARRPLRGRRVREFRAPCAVAGGGLLVADGALRARDPRAASRGMARVLPVDRARRPHVLPEPRRPRAPRRRAWPRGHARAFLRYARAAGARARDSEVQARRAVADERCARAALRSDDMSGISATAKPRLGRGFRLQWEEAQQTHVLLYPEGIVKLNGSAGAIMTRCDGTRTLEAIVDDLER